ncbi:MAG TPA: PQQ-binding-like beta-propeller repeat protein [Gemmatimonadaceae bacterium]|nr:PQQ-binding-like beta-propeller repeat protein [Gemmatimonadaceae bacterium]
MRSVTFESRLAVGGAVFACASLLILTSCSSNSSPPAAVGPLAGSSAPTIPGMPVTAAGTGAAPVGPTTPVGTGAAGSAVTTPPPGTGVAGGGATPPGGTPDVTQPPPPSMGMPTEVPTTPPGGSEWRMIGYDLGSTYNNTAEKKLTKDNAAQLKEIYTVDMGSNVYGAPLQIGDKMYLSGTNVRAIDAASGTEIWKAAIPSTSSLSFDNGILYLNDDDGQINALNAADGKPVWKMPADKQRSDGSSSALVVGDLVLIGGSSGGAELGGGAFRGYMSALDKKTGAVKWTTYTVPEGAKGASIWSSPSADLAAGVAYGGTGNNYGAPATDTSDAFIAFDLATGVIKWKNQRVMNDTFGGGIGPDADFGANPVLFETMVNGTLTKVVAAGNKGGQAHAIKRDDGSMLWQRNLCGGAADGSQGVFVNSTWSGKNLIIACNEGGPATLYGLDGATGNIAWMRRLAGQVWGRISVANGVGFVGTGTNLEAFDVDTGVMIKSFASKGGSVAGTISIANGRVAFGEGMTWSTARAGRMVTVLALP